MGINNLLPFLREKCPDAFRDLSYSFFKGKRVAVDSDNVLRKLMSRAHKEVVNETDVCTKEPDRKQIVEKWLYHVKEEINKFLNYGITLIFVFDGAYIDEKSETQLKRREDKAKRIKEAEDMKAEILKLDELERTPQMITELRKKMHHLGTIKPEEKEKVINFFKALGIPVLFATEEGEKLCAMLCIEGKVSAVYSRDSDLIAMGCPLSFSEEAGWVYNPETKRTELALKCVFFKPILAKLEMEYSSFLDLCIMSGCDFNNNIYRVGIATAYKILKNCQSIDNLPEKYTDKKDILNHQRCREIFKRQSSKNVCLHEMNLNLSCSINKEKMEELDLSDWTNDFLPLFINFPIPSEMCVEKAPSLSSSRVRLKILNDNNDNKIPKQKASPKKINQTIINSLASQQLTNYKLKIVS